MNTEEINVGIPQINAGVIEKFMQELPEKALNLGIRVVFATLLLLIGIQVIKIIRKLLKNSLRRTNVDKGAIQFLDSFVKAAMYLVLIFMVATGFGLDTASVLAVLGSAGVAIGLAVQGSLANLAGGILILLVKPFKVGDYIIEDNKKNEGTVTEIQIFYTKLTTPDQKVIVLPNGTLANTSLTNVTAISHRRLDLTIGIAYSTDLQKAKQLMQTIMEEDEKVLKDMEVMVFVDELALTSVVLGMRCYLLNDDYWPARSRLLECVKAEFDRNGIEIPFPQMDVHLK